MKKQNRILIGLFLAGILLAGALFGFSERDRQAKDNAFTEAPGEQNLHISFTTNPDSGFPPGA